MLITPEELRCAGCRTEGVKTPFCADFCGIRRCVRGKGLDTCAECAALPGCETLARITGNTPAALENLTALRAYKVKSGQSRNLSVYNSSAL